MEVQGLVSFLYHLLPPHFSLEFPSKAIGVCFVKEKRKRVKNCSNGEKNEVCMYLCVTSIGSQK